MEAPVKLGVVVVVVAVVAVVAVVVVVVVSLWLGGLLSLWRSSFRLSLWETVGWWRAYPGHT